MERHYKYQFSMVIFLMLLIGCSSIYFLGNLYFTTKNMYEHPYAVSNKLKEIKSSVHQIHLATLSTDEVDIRDIGRKDAQNRENLGVIASQYLGDKHDVESLNSLYEQWISHGVYGDSDVHLDTEHAIFEKLLQSIQILSDFADNKAAEYYHLATSSAKKYTVYIGLALLMSAIMAIILLSQTLKELREITVNRKQYQYLIDQNVMLTSIDSEGQIFDVSNHLSRYLSIAKQDMIGNQLKDVFFATDEMWQQVKSGATWHGELQVTDAEGIQWLGVDILPMQESDYSYSGFRLLANDITSRKSLEKVSITDTLTGLLNRRSFDDTLERQVKLSFRNKIPITIAMLDIDCFKQYNDTYGHPAGDKALSNIAAVLNRMLARPGDFVFRLGGEEFCLMFNSNNAADSKVYLEKIREAIQSLEILHEQSTVDKYMTISSGAVFFDGELVVDGKLLLSDADDNLYSAKELRNQTVQTSHSSLKSLI